MKVLLFTEAWEPQVNGVVTAYRNFIREWERHGHEVTVVHPHTFSKRVGLPSYPEIRLPLPPYRIDSIVEHEQPDAIHIATEGPLGFAVRQYCKKHHIPFTTACHTKFPDYVGTRVPIGSSMASAVSAKLQRRFHDAAAATFVTSRGMLAELQARGFSNLVLWERGIDRELFNSSHRREHSDYPRPIFLYAGRVAVEKNLPAFLDLPLPGTKMVVGDGPARDDLETRYPDAVFLGHREHGEELAACMASADVFVFPSTTDTFGLVMLESISCGTPVAAYETHGAREILEWGVNGYYGNDLEQVARDCLEINRTHCEASAKRWGWERSVETFYAVWEKIWKKN